MDPTEVAALSTLLREIVEQTSDETGGALASYIPELATVAADRFAIAICSVDGEVVAVGDVDQEFTLQSTCKPFLYGRALGDIGRRAVRRRVGVEPTGEAFDSLVRLEAGRHRAHNPLVNTGAIAIAGLLAGAGRLGDRPDVNALLAAYAGVPALGFGDAVFASEQATNFRNRAIAHLLRAFGIIDVEADVALARYVDACSTLVTAPRLATMAATLAGGGVTPGTARRVLSRRVAADVLAVMSTCGMYDAAGHFAFDIGLPAKSGVSGAIMAVVPNRFGIAVFSPRIDERGMSVRGQRALALLADALRLHPLEAPLPPERPRAGSRRRRRLRHCSPRSRPCTRAAAATGAAAAASRRTRPDSPPPIRRT